MLLSAHTFNRLGALSLVGKRHFVASLQNCFRKLLRASGRREEGMQEYFIKHAY